jgi:hypothetical protein
MVVYYRKSDGNTKKKILSCIFSKKIVLEKSKVATYEFTTPIRLDETEVFELNFNDPEVKREFYSLQLKTPIGNLYFLITEI